MLSRFVFFYLFFLFTLVFSRPSEGRGDRRGYRRTAPQGAAGCKWGSPSPSRMGGHNGLLLSGTALTAERSNQGPIG